MKRYPQSKASLKAALEILELDAFDTRLKTHNLKAPFEGVWACSEEYDLRVLFEFVSYEDKEESLLLTVGSHDEVY